VFSVRAEPPLRNNFQPKGCKPQAQALRVANLDKVFDGLNALGRVSWKINVDILEAAKRCWDDANLGDIPSQFDFDVPPLPQKPAFVNRVLFENKKQCRIRKVDTRLENISFKFIQI
jgi:DNA-directed RNA polymerase